MVAIMISPQLAKPPKKRYLAVNDEDAIIASFDCEDEAKIYCERLGLAMREK